MKPLNRYETNLLKTISDSVDFLKTLSTNNVKLLADLFHMNIEEVNLAESLRDGAGYVGHIHFVGLKSFGSRIGAHRFRTDCQGDERHPFQWLCFGGGNADSR
jgi:sugar phosphate isomerase/epimerase